MQGSLGGIVLSILLIPSFPVSAADLKPSRFTQIINDVKVLDLSTKETAAATVNEVINWADMIRTGPGSRAELIANDGTITRIGANSFFSFDFSNHTISLDKGSILFQTPKGKGGGTIRTTSAVASVLATTMIVAATDDGGFKALLLEGSGKVTLPNGKSATLKPGQMVFVLPNEEGLSRVITFKLADQVEGSLLVNGFDVELPSINLIKLEIARQNKLIANGRAVDTGLLVGESATLDRVQLFDPNVLQDIFGERRAKDADHCPVDPFPVVSNLSIGAVILEDQYLQTEPGVGHFLQGYNVLVNAETVDMRSVSEFPKFSVIGNNVVEFADNASHSTTFLGIQSQTGSARGVNELYLSAGDFVFPNEFTLKFDGRVLSLWDSNDLTLRSDSSVGLRLRPLAPEGTIMLGAVRDLTLYGNVRLNADRLKLHAGNNLAVEGCVLDFNVNAKLYAGNQLYLNHVGVRNLGFAGNPAEMYLSAHTIILQNVLFAFDSVVYLECGLGQLASNPNSGAAVVPGMVNFIRNVNFGAGRIRVPAQNFIGKKVFVGTRH